MSLALGIAIGRIWFSGAPASQVEATSQEAEPEPLYWVAPMDPNYRRDQPGKSPMGMDLVPVYADQHSSDAILIEPQVEQNLGVRSETVTRGPFWRRIRATGQIEPDQGQVSHIHLRTAGWIEVLNLRAEGDPVKTGEVLLEFYSPEVVNAQRELLQVLRGGNQSLLEGAREKLRALGVSQVDIEGLVSSRQGSDTFRILAPHDGIVAELNVREGMHVMPETEVLALADLSRVWVEARVFESQAAWVRAGQAAEVRIASLPGQVFEGEVDYVHPMLDATTQTLPVRIVLDNPDGQLRPDQYASVTLFGGRLDDVISIPREALIRSGDHQRVVVALGDGRFAVQEVVAGIESGDWVEIRAGLKEGYQVVVSGQFLIDSEASLAGSMRRLQANSMDHRHD